MSTVAFDTKDFVGIIADMIGHSRETAPGVTDYNIGSVARTMLEAPAIEIDALYQAMYSGLIDAIPTAIYEGFSFTALPPQAASGYVTFSIEEPRDTDTTIAALTTVRNPTSPVEYQTQATVTIPAGETSISVWVAATSAGADTNAIKETLTAYLPVQTGVTVFNPESISGGSDEETADERRIRFMQYVQSLARGTVASLQYAALQGVVYSLGRLPIERVRQCAIEETAGHVNVYIYNGTGGTSDELLEDVTQKIEGYYDQETGRWVAGYRPAGMRVDVRKMTEVPLPVSIEVDAPAGNRTSATIQAIEDAIAFVISGQRSHPVLRPIEIVNAVLGVSGIDGCLILSPTDATAIESASALVPGTITITWAT